MQLFGYNLSKNKPSAEPVAKMIDKGESFVQFSRPELPKIKESKNLEWVLFGDNHCYPKQLLEWYNTSSTHRAIVTTKTNMVAGEDVLFGGTESSKLTGSDKQLFNLLEPDLIHKLALDTVIFNAFALEIIWNADHTIIAEINHMNVSKVASGKKNENGEVDFYFYSNDWEKVRNNPPLKLHAFNENPITDDKGNIANNHQVLYVHRYNPTMDYYGQPSYVATLSWIEMESLIANFHLSNINNGFNPGVVIKYYKRPGSPQEKDEIVRSIHNMYRGTNASGKAMIFFCDDKDTATDVIPVEPSRLDKQFEVLLEQITQMILIGHQVTSPMLFGIATPGKLGYSNELETAYRLFDRNQANPDQKLITDALNLVLPLYGIQGEVSIEKNNPLEDEMDQNLTPETFTMVMQILSQPSTQTALNRDQKLALLTQIGLSEEEAIQLVPLTAPAPTTPSPNNPPQINPIK